jgi:hypothetical protein
MQKVDVALWLPVKIEHFQRPACHLDDRRGEDTNWASETQPSFARRTAGGGYPHKVFTAQNLGFNQFL